MAFEITRTISVFSTNLFGILAERPTPAHLDNLFNELENPIKLEFAIFF